ncbi:Ran-specific GTPase-activating protein 30 [Emydomyces testavorans]|uniref:Ran-specific GTPase-activating protein 30 n=1 Tax=Emydomyces testavorans TaxID=2070801 RepID=A0AAF0DHM9_9EURO|nr:Ran-specific GTPase-activating protein 30 [Emydomyces testavorans]
MAGFLTMDKLLLTNIDDFDRSELQILQERLQGKIRIISPAIDMIELIAARGNTSLESAVSLTKGLRWDIQSLGQRLADVVSKEQLSRKGAASSARRGEVSAQIKLIIKDIRQLLDRIEDAVPLINLAITTSGASLSTTLPATVSPSRLLQASTFLTAGDTQYSVSPAQAVQVGPTFILSVYLLFAGHVRPHDEETIRNTTWKEVIHKARLKLRRIPMALLHSHPSSSIPSQTLLGGGDVKSSTKGDEFAYQILIIEDLDDGRVHTFESEAEQASHFEDVAQAGIREVIPIHQISKIFYADTGKILNIGSEGEVNHPVLLLKRDVNAIPPRKMMSQDEVEYDNGDEDGSESTLSHNEPDPGNVIPTQPAESGISTGDRWRFPPGLDLEWVALEVYNESEDSDSEHELDSPESSAYPESADGQINSKLSRLHIDDTKQSPDSPSCSKQHMTIPQPPPGNGSLHTVSNPLFSNIKTSLSLLEMLLRLTSLQQFQQQSHLSIPDELLNFFLEESSTTGAGGDEHHRQRVRAEARRKVGWDPYDESPLKRRGEDYQYGNGKDRNSWTGSPASWRPGVEPHSPNVTPQSRGYRTSEERYNSDSRRIVSRRATASPSPSTKFRAEDRKRVEVWKSKTDFEERSVP